MRDDQKESFWKWGNFLLSTMAFLLACLMGPVAVSLKATLKDLVRQELAGYETVAGSEARWKAHETFQSEVFKRHEHELAAARDQAALNATNGRSLILEVGNRLAVMELKVDQLLQEQQRERKR
jgi:hypothetical protein